MANDALGADVIEGGRSKPVEQLIRNRHTEDICVDAPEVATNPLDIRYRREGILQRLLVALQ